MAGPTRDFWQTKFDAKDTPWDRGATSPQLLQWLPSIGRAQIVVPGCGSGYDVETLARAGCEVFGIDYTAAAVERARARVKEFKNARVVEADVLTWRPPSPVDAVFEQTCLCALHPDHWRTYADNLHAWLKPGGKLYAQLMQAERPGAREGLVEGPPYHCDVNAMRALFPAERWQWPKPPYEKIARPGPYHELAVILTRT